MSAANSDPKSDPGSTSRLLTPSERKAAVATTLATTLAGIAARQAAENAAKEVEIEKKLATRREALQKYEASIAKDFTERFLDLTNDKPMDKGWRLYTFASIEKLAKDFKEAGWILRYSKGSHHHDSTCTYACFSKSARQWDRTKGQSAGAAMCQSCTGISQGSMKQAESANPQT